LTIPRKPSVALKIPNSDGQGVVDVVRQGRETIRWVDLHTSENDAALHVFQRVKWK